VERAEGEGDPQKGERKISSEEEKEHNRKTPNYGIDLGVPV